MKKSYKIALLALFLPVLACDNNNEMKQKSLADLKQLAVEAYAEIVYATYDDAVITAKNLQDKIEAFVAAPSEEGLNASKEAWLAARIPYGQSEAFRFYGGPIDDEDGPEGFLNAWPIDENYIDYTVTEPDNGIINDLQTYPVIDKDLLLSLNEEGSETNISTGYHAIEFLLWGQDLNNNSAGDRPYTDYVQGGSSTNAGRRGQYLLAATELLVEQLEEVRDAWADGATYREEFTNAVTLPTSIQNIFDGIGILSKGELAGERMLVAAVSHDQENEHSCFSDNTQADLEMNFAGIRNVYFGSYKRIDNSIVSGISFKEIAERVNNEKAQALEDSFAEVEAKLNAIPSPFDQAILNDTDKIKDAANSLSVLSDRIADVLVDLKK